MFFFGGSTAFGYGAAGNETIAASPQYSAGQSLDLGLLVGKEYVT